MNSSPCQGRLVRRPQRRPSFTAYLGVAILAMALGPVSCTTPLRSNSDSGGKTGALDYAVIHKAFPQLSTSGLFIRGLRREGSVFCAGENSDGEASPPTGKFAQISSGGTHVCTLDVESRISCWGANSLGQSTPPSGQFVQISTGLTHSCALQPD